MARNTYVRNGSVERFDDGTYRGLMLCGEKKYDPHAMIEPHSIPYSQLGRPHEMVLHIAGVMYYPTPTGYELIEQIERK